MRFLGSAVVFSILLQSMSAQLEAWQSAKSIYEFTATDIDGSEVSLEKYSLEESMLVDKSLSPSADFGLSESTYFCGNGFHSNFEMPAKYAERGLRILAFPSNQFGHQEPETNSQIKEFAKSYNAEFDMFSKTDVNGDSAHPLWKWLKEQPNGRGFLGNSSSTVKARL
nr:glutathione peroxidase [Cyprinus carpio]